MRWILALLSAPALAYALTIPYVWDAPQTWQSGDWYEYEATVNGAVVTAGATSNTSHTLELPGVDGAMVGFRVRSCRDDDGETLCSDSCNGFPASTSPCRDGWTYLDTPHPSTPQNRAQQLSDNPEPPVMAVSFVGGSGAINTSDNHTSASITHGVTIAENDYILLIVSQDPWTGQGAYGTITPPSGFDLLGSQEITLPEWAKLSVYGKFAGSSEPSSYSVSTSLAMDDTGLAVAVYRGVDQTTPVPTIVFDIDESSNTTATVPAITIANDGSFRVAIATGDGFTDLGGAGTRYSGWGASLTERVDVKQQYTSIGIADVEIVTAGAQSSANVTQTTSTRAVTCSIELKAASGSGATASLTGQSVATALGVLTSTGQALHALSGQSITSALGSLSASGSIAVSLSGNEIASALGALDATGAAVKALTGSAVTSALGNLSATGRGQVSLSGLATTSTLGDLAATGAAAHTLSGQSITSGLGTLSASGSISVELSGLSVSSQLGTLTGTGAAAITLSGNEIASALGTVQTVNGASITLTGMQAAVSLGDVTAATTATVTLSGLRINAALGTITGTGAATVTLSGNDIASALGTLSASAGGEGALLATVTLTPALDAALTVTAPRRTS